MRSLRACGCVVERGQSCAAHPPLLRWRGSTAARGYGGAHQRKRAAELPAAYGKPCSRCGQEMAKGQVLHLDHTADRSGYRGFSHKRCNEANR